MSGGMGGGEAGVPDDLLTTKGDTHGYTTENARVPIGADTQVLTADSTQALGLAWQAPAAGYLAPTLGTTVIPSNTTVSTLNALALTSLNDSSLAATKKLYFDGGSNTYIHEGAADSMQFVTAGVQALVIASNQVVYAKAGLGIDPTDKLWLDGGGDTYIYEPSANLSAVVAGNSTKMAWGTLGTSIPATQRFYLDGSAPTGNTYFHESSADNIQFVAGGAAIADIDTNGIDILGNNIDNVQKVIHDLTTLTGVTGGIRTIDFNGDQLQQWNLSGSSAISFATSSNKATGVSQTIRLVNDASAQDITLPASWKIVGAVPTSIAASKTAVLTLTCFGIAETDIVAAYAVEE